MRIAVISDIHGVLVALDAVLDDMDRDRYDEIVCLGDVALRGPQPVECLERVQDLGCPVVMGNTDEWMVSESPTWQMPDDSDPVMEIDLWCVGQLTGRDRDFLRSFQPTVEMNLGSADTVSFSTRRRVITLRTSLRLRRKPTSKRWSTDAMQRCWSADTLISS